MGVLAFLMVITLTDAEGYMLAQDSLKKGQAQKIGAVLRTRLRPTDVVCRYGGTQYLVLMTGTVEKMCDKLQDKIRIAIRVREPQLDVGFDLIGL